MLETPLVVAVRHAQGEKALVDDVVRALIQPWQDPILQLTPTEDGFEGTLSLKAGEIRVQITLGSNAKGDFVIEEASTGRPGQRYSFQGRCLTIGPSADYLDDPDRAQAIRMVVGTLKHEVVKECRFRLRAHEPMPKKVLVSI